MGHDKGGTRPKLSDVMAKRRENKVRQDFRDSTRSFADHELATDWTLEEKRIDDETRRREDYYSWKTKHEQKAASSGSGRSEFEVWRAGREEWHDAQRREIAERDRVIAEAIRAADEDRRMRDTPEFELHGAGGLYAGLHDTLPERTATILNVSEDLVREMMAGPRLVMRQNAHDMPVLFERILEPIRESWVHASNNRDGLGRVSLDLGSARGTPLGPKEARALDYLEADLRPHNRGLEVIENGFDLLRLRYERLKKAIDSYHELVQGAAVADVKELIKLGERHYESVDLLELTKRADAVRDELDCTLAAHALVTRLGGEQNRALDPYVTTGALVYLSAFGEEIAGQLANRAADPTYSIVLDILCEDSRLADPDKKGAGVLEEIEPEQLPKEIKKRATTVGKRLPSDSFARDLLKAVVGRSKDLDRTLREFEQCFVVYGPAASSGLPEMADAARRLAFETRMMRDLMAGIPGDGERMEGVPIDAVNKPYLLEPVDALVEHARRRLALSVSED